MSSQTGNYELYLTTTDRSMEDYSVILKRYENEFNSFKVHQPGLRQNENIIIILEKTINSKRLADFRLELCASLEAVGIIINRAYMITVNNMGDKESIKEEISKLPKIKYFLMIGNSSSYNAVAKWIKMQMKIRGNYKCESKVFGTKKLFPLCLEINRQCRGVNYCCPNNFPKNVAFIHFILSDDQISCCSNVTKHYQPHIFKPSWDIGETDYIQKLEDNLSVISGRLVDKNIEIIIITFENHLSHDLSKEVASKMYVAAKKLKSEIKCGVAEIILTNDKTRISLCRALQYDGELDSGRIEEYLKACNNCDDLRLQVNANFTLPQQIKIAHINFTNIHNNYDEFEISRKRKLSESDIANIADTAYLYPKIKQRNHIINNENDDFILI